MPRTPLDSSPGFKFPIPTEGRVGYVYTSSPALTNARRILMEFRITGNASFIPADRNDRGPAKVVLYFQRSGDDMSCSTSGSNTQYYRWWSKANVVLRTGDRFVLESSLKPEAWVSCWGRSGNDAQEAFYAAKKTAQKVGFTLSGQMSAGHGIRASNRSSEFKLSRFLIE